MTKDSTMNSVERAIAVFEENYRLSIEDKTSHRLTWRGHAEALHAAGLLAPEWNLKGFRPIVSGWYWALYKGATDPQDAQIVNACGQNYIYRAGCTEADKAEDFKFICGPLLNPALPQEPRK